MAGILSYEPAFDRKIAENSSQSLKRDRRPSFPVSKWTKILGTSVCINQNFRKFRSKTQWIYKTRCNLHLATLVPEVVLDFSPREKETSTYQRASRFVLAALLVSNILLTSQSLCMKLYPPLIYFLHPHNCEMDAAFLEPFSFFQLPGQKCSTLCWYSRIPTSLTLEPWWFSG